ncbi:hypothetical protein PHMEG_00034122 [Phytophthora megakarya]|uniref:PX domain-containing protein n=1 Tax=Phytophthora megakarya TaxID=4795 RepID=A0A225URS9_9STRA|nr:hypothetical protein PHMEG_00034122 [Phytophthora megakarya]
MKVISVHITGFYHSSFHAYTTEVNVDGHRWRLGLRYSKFHEFFEQLAEKKKDFHAEFPPKGTLFFTPKPEERQEQLDIFMQHVLEYYAKGHATEVEDLLCALLKVPRHLRSPEHEDDDMSTSTESVLDEPMHSNDNVAEVRKESQEDEKQGSVLEAEPEVAVAKEDVSDPEPEQPANPEIEKYHPVEEVDTYSVHEEEEAEQPTSVMESETAKETEDGIATVVEKEAIQDKVEPIVTEASAEQLEGIKIKDESVNEAADVVAEDTDSAEPNPEEPDVTSPQDQPLVESVAGESAPPQAAESSTVCNSVSPTRHVVQKDITTSSRVSSWITAIFPQSLIGFIRHRCMKKTNLVVLCVALLLPMVLARR